MIDNIFQNLRIKQAENVASKAVASHSSNKIKISDLEDKVDYLSVVCLALSELLEEVGFSKEMLLRKIEEIDLRDGILDGKLKINSFNVCGKCSRKLAARHTMCIYCGSKIKKEHVF